jgi:predicted RNA-binding protein with PIN domain
MKSLIIVDGYNFIFKYHENSGIESGQLEMLREKLIDDLVQYRHNFGHDIIIVFDSHKSTQPGRHSTKVQGVEVIFSGKSKNADSVIEELAHSKEGYDNKFIVTSDNIQQTVIFKENIYRKSVREFCSELNSQKREVREKLDSSAYSTGHSFSSIEKRLSQKSKDEFLKIKEKLKNKDNSPGR